MSPWQLLKVVAYAGAKGNWRRWRVWPECNFAENVIRGINRSSFSTVLIPLMSFRSRTVISRLPRPTIMTLVFLTSALSIEKFQSSRNTHPNLMFMEWSAIPGGVCFMT